MNDFNSLISTLFVFFKFSNRSLKKKVQCLNPTTLPPPELVEEVNPLVVKEALSIIPEEKSPTLMIDGVLGDLVRWGLLKPKKLKRRRRGQALHLKKTTIREEMLVMGSKSRILSKNILRRSKRKSNFLFK